MLDSTIVIPGLLGAMLIAANAHSAGPAQLVGADALLSRPGIDAAAKSASPLAAVAPQAAGRISATPAGFGAIPTPSLEPATGATRTAVRFGVVKEPAGSVSGRSQSKAAASADADAGGAAPEVAQKPSSGIPVCQ